MQASTKSIIVVDNFYKDPLKVRALALSTEYNVTGAYSPNFAGVESQYSLYSTGVVDKLATLVGAPIDVRPDCNAFGRFRVAIQQDKRKTRVHFDNTEWTAVVYLSLDKYCQGGTYFFKHKETGLEGPPTERELAKLGMTSRRDFDQKIMLRDTLREDSWELTTFVSMKFNRCILFRGDTYFHAADRLFGSDPESARITQNFFFNTKAAA